MKFFSTIVTASHFPYAQALAESLRASGNTEPLYVLLVGSSKSSVPAGPGVTVLELDELQVPFPPLMRYYYSAFELCNALKPFLVAHLFRAQRASQVIYLDSDLLVTGSFERVWDESERTSLILTPHHFSPPPLSAKYTNEVDVIELGFLNGGFAAWRATPATERMLSWMCERFPVYGFYRYLGMASDQKLLPLLLAYFPDEVVVSFDPGLNIAYWNAHERPVEHVDGRWQIEGRPVVFFHMSGYKLSHPGFACAYVSEEANRGLLASAPWLRDVMARYGELLARFFAGQKPPAYAYDEFDGVKLNQDFRRLLFRTGRLDRADPAFWRIWCVQNLRAIKRLLTGVRPLR